MSAPSWTGHHLRQRQPLGVVRESIVEVRPHTHLISPVSLFRNHPLSSLCFLPHRCDSPRVCVLQPSTAAGFVAPPQAGQRYGTHSAWAAGQSPVQVSLDDTNDTECTEDVESCPHLGHADWMSRDGRGCGWCQRTRGCHDCPRGPGRRWLAETVEAARAWSAACFPRARRVQMQARARRVLVNLPFLLMTAGTVLLVVHLWHSPAAVDVAAPRPSANATGLCGPAETPDGVWIRGVGVARAPVLREGTARVVLQVDTERCASGQAFLHVQSVATVDYEAADGTARARLLEGDAAYCVQSLLAERAAVYEGACVLGA